MPWIGKVVGGVIGAVVGGPFGAAIGVSIGSHMDGDDASIDPTIGDTPQLSVRAQSSVDDIGEYCEVQIQTTIPADCIARFSVRKNTGEFVAAIADYSDSEGDFCRVVQVVDGVCKCYIPYTALRPTAHGPHILFLQVRTREGDGFRQIGWASLAQDVPNRGPWNHAHFLLPVIQLFFALAMTDGDASAAAVKVIRQACEEELGLCDATMLHNALKQARADVRGVDGNEVVRVACQMLERRVGAAMNLDAGAPIFLAIARCDGHPSPRRIALLRSILVQLGMTTADWESFSQAHQLGQSRHYATLGVQPGATAAQIQDAYRRLIKEWHPDRYASLPVELQQLAQRRAIELREAYDALRSG